MTSHPLAWLTYLNKLSPQKIYILTLCSSIGITLLSYAVGSVRRRGGLLQYFNLNFLNFGHAMAVLVVLLWIALGIFIIVWINVGRIILGKHGDTINIRLYALLSLIPLCFSSPLMSRDIYSYLNQGALVRDGYDPYKVGPSANPGPMLFEVSGDWRNTTTPYGPLHLWLMESITRITGDNITLGILLYRSITIISFIALTAAILRIAQHYGTRQEYCLWLGIANPVVAIHLLGGLHNEAIMMAGVGWALVYALDKKIAPALVISSLLIGTATALKATAAIAFPFILWILVDKVAGSEKLSGSKLRIGTHTWKRIPALLWIGLSSFAIVLGTIALITVLSDQNWGWVRELSGNSKVINPLAFPSFLAGSAWFISRFNDDITFNMLLENIRPVSTMLMLLGLILSWILYRHNARQALIGMSLAYLITCIFNSVVLPWYYVAPLLLSSVWLYHRRGIILVAWCSTVISMMFDGGGNNKLYDLWWIVLIGVFCAILIHKNFPSPSEFRSPSLERDASPHEPNVHVKRPLDALEGSRPLGKDTP